MGGRLRRTLKFCCPLKAAAPELKGIVESLESQGSSRGKHVATILERFNIQLEGLGVPMGSV